MGIQEIAASLGSGNATESARLTESRQAHDEAKRDARTDSFTVSGSATSLYSAEQSRRFDIVRERIRLGYYGEKNVVDQVVKSLAKEMHTV